MPSTPFPPDAAFTEAKKVWHLEPLYQALAEAGQILTPTQKIHLCGLLVGYSPQQIAQKLHRSQGGLRVDLSRLYQDIGILFPSHEINSRTIAHVLTEAGYRRNLQEPTANILQGEVGEEPGGQLSLSSKYYIARSPSEERWYEAILRPGALLRIKAPRQMGKTSLMSRIINHARQHGCWTTSHSFQFEDEETFANLAIFLQRFCASISYTLEVPDGINNHWNDHLSSTMNCKVYFEHLLNKSNQPLVVALDEVDRIFQYPHIATDFLGLLRGWFEWGRNHETWRKLRLIVVHSTEAYLQLPATQSPFNVGESIVLNDFRPEQVWDLAQRYGQHWTSAHIEQLLNLVGGHPFLLQVALYRISLRELTLAELLHSAATEMGVYQEHLRRYLWILHHDPSLRKAMMQVIQSDAPVQLETFVARRLWSLGLISFEGNNVKARCGLYRQYFRDRLSAN
ncbi:MAG: AAA-like domain-containing protein [Leptolyngbyaceae cyanobacterium bins.349]|nr:AAA-like domain-containing protein [Leptolyngbyaceae cyanobacterium bins.349]